MRFQLAFDVVRTYFIKVSVKGYFLSYVALCFKRHSMNSPEYDLTKITKPQQFRGEIFK